MTRSRAMLAVPIVLAIVLIGVFVMQSRGGDDAQVKAADATDCPPVARADAVATKPGVPISIDVLANDTDPDGDPLVFQILSTQGGESTIDDGGTPTDASDDRVLFTPEDPPPTEASIEYQALDPQGSVSESQVKVSINDQGALAAGESSDSVAETATETDPEGDGSGDCDTGVVPTSSTAPGGTIAPSPPFTGDVTVTTKKATTSAKSSKKKSSSGGTTRTTRTTREPTATTQRPTTTRPPTTTPPPTNPPNTTTTQPSGPPPTAPNNCGEFPVNGSEEEQDAWRACVRG